MVHRDICGQPYVKVLPKGYFTPTIHDFVQQGRKKVGMEYLAYSKLYDYYYICILTENTTGKYINNLIQQGIIFIHPSHKFLVCKSN